MNNHSQDYSSGLFETVVKGGYCIGCGACSVVENSPVKIKLNQFSQLIATTESDIAPELDKKLQSVCPFSNRSANEDEIGKELYGNNAAYDPKLGYHRKVYAGHISEGNFRDSGSSGGMGSWILSTLLQEGLVDGVIHVKDRLPTSDDPRLFHYQLSTNKEQILAGAKSKYYPIELSEVVQMIKERPGQYAVVGIPCFIKSVRLLARQDEILNDRIKFCIGLICGHLKSGRFAEMFAWQCGVRPSELQSIDFRTKIEGYGANQYGVTVKGVVDSKPVVKTSLPVNQMYGTNWGLGYFKYKACDYCDDVVGETADLTIGDAWLPQFVNDSKGTNVIVVRNVILEQLIQDASNAGKLSLEDISVAEAIQSQSSGFNHRREGLAYRLLLTDKAGKWRPKKRVPAGNNLTPLVQKIQDQRILLAERSHVAFKKAIEKDSFEIFVKEMEPLVSGYHNLYRGSLWQRVVRKIKSKLKIANS